MALWYSKEALSVLSLRLDRLPHPPVEPSEPAIRAQGNPRQIDPMPCGGRHPVGLELGSPNSYGQRVEAVKVASEAMRLVFHEDKRISSRARV